MTIKEFAEWEDSTFGYGYGTGEAAIIDGIRHFFTLLEDGRKYNFEVLEKEIGAFAAWLLINAFCKSNIVEYGTSPRFGWLTGKGEGMRDLFKELGAALYKSLRNENECARKEDEHNYQ